MEKELQELGFTKSKYRDIATYYLDLPKEDLVITVIEDTITINGMEEYEGYATPLFLYNIEKLKSLINLLKKSKKKGHTLNCMSFCCLFKNLSYNVNTKLRHLSQKTICLSN